MKKHSIIAAVFLSFLMCFTALGIQTYFDGVTITNSAIYNTTNYSSVYTNGTFYGNGAGLTNISAANLLGLGTAAYSNATAFYPNSNPSNYVTASVTNGLATTNYVNNATNGFVTSSITNGLATTNYVNAATNGFVTSSITNGLATTNYVNNATNGLVTSSITNGLATTNYVNNATNGLVTSSITNGLATTNFVLTQISATNSANLTTTTNLVVAATNNFTTVVYSNPVVFLYTNSLPGLTNGFVTSSITNGLATTNFVLTQISATNSANLTTTTNLVVAATNNFTTVVYSNPVVFLYTNSLPTLTNGFVTASVTNGLATTNYVNSVTNGLVTSAITNGLATTNYVQSYSDTNGAAAFYSKNSTNGFTTLVYTNPSAVLYTNSLPTLTNGFVTASVTNGLASTNFVNTSIANNTNFPSIYVTNTLQVQGYVQGPLYITNSAFDISTNTASPSANQLVTANYVASILKSGQILYGSLNTTNVGITNRVGTTTNTVALLFGSTAPTNYIKSFTNLTAGQIFATIITTNTYQSVSGPFVSTFYLNFTGNGPNPSIQIDPDIYITYDKTNLLQIGYGAAQTITPGTTNAYSWISGGQQYTSTNVAGFYVVRRVFCDAVTSSGTYVLNVFGGTNYPTSLTFNTPVTLNANYSGTFTGTYIGDGSGLTNITATNGFTTLVYTNPSTILYTNALPGLTNGFVTASVTNGLATTNYVNSATQGLTNGLATTNYVNSITNGLATTNYVKAATNGFVTSSITNGLATTNYVNAATFSLTNIGNDSGFVNLTNAAFYDISGAIRADFSYDGSSGANFQIIGRAESYYDANTSQSAGIFLSDSTLAPAAFFGMKDDSHAGFFFGGDWNFVLDTSGNVTVGGKLTANGGIDPPYMLLDAQTRAAIKGEVLFEVPTNKQTGAAVFFNAATHRLEIYVASEDAFYDLNGEVIATNIISRAFTPCTNRPNGFGTIRPRPPNVNTN